MPRVRLTKEEANVLDVVNGHPFGPTAEELRNLTGYSNAAEIADSLVDRGLLRYNEGLGRYQLVI